MYDDRTITLMDEYLMKAARAMASWLSEMLPKSGDDWWKNCVLDNLSFNQREMTEKKGFNKLEDFDSAAHIRIADWSCKLY